MGINTSALKHEWTQFKTARKSGVTRVFTKTTWKCPPASQTQLQNIPQISALFQALVALPRKLRRANSVRTRGSCSWPLSVARVLRLDCWERYMSFSRRISDASVAVNKRRTIDRWCSSIRSSTRPHPSSWSTLTCSRRPRPATIRAPKLMAFWTRFLCSAVQLPQTLIQCRTCGKTSALSSADDRQHWVETGKPKSCPWRSLSPIGKKYSPLSRRLLQICLEIGK